jgi:hypothetical protein
MLTNYSRILLDLLEEQETVSSKIYAAYARRFPRYSAMWEKMSKDETNHAKWVHAIRKAVEAEKVSVNPKILRLEALQKQRLFLHDRLEGAESLPLDAGQALRITAEIEESYLEQPFTKVFLAEQGKAAVLLFKLEAETARHAEQVLALLRNLGMGKDGAAPKKQPRK